MIKLIGISGSLRKKSFNTALLRAAAKMLPEGSELEVASIASIPVYDGDLEDSGGIPASVTDLKDRIAACQGLILATPEYNNSIPGGLKNAIDWMTRPSKDIGRVFGNRAVGIIGATPGKGGTRMAQTAWLPVLRTLSVRPFFARSLFMTDAATMFDADLNLTDDTMKKVLGSYMKAFLEFIGGA